MIDPNNYLFRIIKRRRTDENLEALRKSVEAMVLSGDQRALMTQKQFIEQITAEEGRPKDQMMEIVDAGLLSLNSKLMKAYVEETNTFDAIIDGRVEGKLAFVKQYRGTEVMKRFNARLAERNEPIEEQEN